MRPWILAVTALALAAGAPLSAQAANLGLAVTLGVPTGQFNNINYGGGASEGYNAAVGVQFTASFPVDRNLALRLNLGGLNFSGNAYDGQGNRLDASDSFFSLGGEAQVFLGDGNAMRHTGTYLIGGLELDLERFDYSTYSPYVYQTTDKSRLGLEVGIGHSFRYYGRWRWTLEATYHKTLTGTNTDAGDPPPADFVKVAWGMIF